MGRRLGHVAAALLIAMGLWLVVHNLDRLPADFRVPITYDHPPSIVKVPSYPTEAVIRVLATKPKMRTLQAAELSIHVPNVEGRTGREIVVLDPDDVAAPFGVVVREVSPAQFSIVYDRALTRRLPVEVDLRGSPADGYEVVRDEMGVTPAEVEVSGPESLFDGHLVVRTERVEITDRSTSLFMPRLALVPPAEGFEIRGVSSVAAAIRIQPRITRVSFEQVPVRILQGQWQVTYNPREVRVTIEGPEPQLRSLPTSAIHVVVDASELTPQGDDYRLEPRVSVDAGECAGCKVLALSQKRVNVHVKHARRRAGSTPDGRGGTGPPARRG